MRGSWRRVAVATLTGGLLLAGVGLWQGWLGPLPSLPGAAGPAAPAPGPAPAPEPGPAAGSTLPSVPEAAAVPEAPPPEPVDPDRVVIEDGLPSDVPRPRNAREFHQQRLRDGAYLAGYETADAADRVFAELEESFGRDGWSLESAADSGPYKSLVARRANQRVIAYVQELEGRTRILLRADFPDALLPAE